VFCSFLAALCVAFASAIFANNSLTFANASAVSVSRDTVPFSALVSSAAAFSTNVSGVTWGFVMYWCLKNIESLTLVALVLTMYTLKQRWCSIDVPMLKPTSPWASHVLLFLGLTCAMTEHPSGANGFRM
jgi:hypothetical protein